MPARRLAPLLAGTAAGSLGPADLEEIGISIVAVDILELRLTVGFDRIRAAGGLGTFIGWRGPMVAVARYTDQAPATTGWRGRGLPQVLREVDGVLRLRSSVDGTVVEISLDELRAEGPTLGDGITVAIGDEATATWADPDQAPPPAPIVVSDLAQAQAAAGRYLSAAGWTEIGDAASGPLGEGCTCRACGISSAAYIAHLTAAREITGEHLLGWHNTHQMRLAVEGRA